MVKEKPLDLIQSGGFICLLLLLCDFNELGETGCIVHSQISEHLAVHFDVLLLQTIDERGIAHAVQTGSSVDTGDPQTAEITFAELTSDERVTQAAGNLFFSGAVLLGFRSPVAFRQLHNLAATLMGVKGPLNACQVCFPPCR